MVICETGNPMVSLHGLLYGEQIRPSSHPHLFNAGKNCGRDYEMDGKGEDSMSEREIQRLRGFYQGLTDVVDRCHKHAVETNGVMEGLLGLCQEQLTMLAELESENARLSKENENIAKWAAAKEAK